MQLKDARVAVIGGAGLIGSHVVEELCKEDVGEIRVFDNFVRGSVDNLRQARGDRRVQVFDGGDDITRPDALEAATAGMDYVVHLAALWLQECHENPRAAFDVNTGGTFNVLEACVKNDVKKLVYSSSASVYGEALAVPMTEEHPYNNRTFYGATKIAGEQMCRAFYERYGLDYVGLRYMNVYGPRQDYRGAYVSVIMKMLDRIDQGLPPVVYGDGSQSYDFVYVRDVAAANVCALKSEASDAFYNVGCGRETSIKGLGELLLEMTGADLEIHYEPAGQTFVSRRVGSTRRAADELGFAAETGLRDGLRQLIEWRARDKSRGAAADRKPIAISRPAVGAEEWRALGGPVASGWLTQGPKVAEFERRFAQMHGVKHALAVSSCTAGLHLALTALGVGPGDEVIVPAFTWIASANAVLYCGATPVFADVERDSYNLDPQQVAARVSARTKAVIPVHLFGLCADIDAIKAALPAGVAVVEDAACAAGARNGAGPAGGLGDAAAFSFHPRKAITTGEGGMVTTDDDELAARLEPLRNHGAALSEERRHAGDQPYLLPDFEVLGFNYRMTDLQGAVGVEQVRKLEGFIVERARWAAYYREQLDGVKWLRLPHEPDRGRHGWQACVAYVDPAQAPMPREALMGYLQDRGIAARPGTHAVTELAYYARRLGTRPDDFPAARDCSRHCMAIPLHNRMDADDFAHVVQTLRSV